MSGRTAPDLGAIRSELEHKPKPPDPFAVSIWPILDVLSDEFGARYHLGYSGGWWWASPVSGHGDRFKAMSPDDLTCKIRAAGGSR